MKKLYITFSGSRYTAQTGKIVERAPKMGADQVLVYDDTWITEQPFYELNHWLWEHPDPRGFGWWIWKPFIIMDALNRCDSGDVVLYTDADTYPVHDLSVLYEICGRETAMFFEASAWNNRQWCKRDTYIVMGQDQEKYHNAKHACARFLLVQKGHWKPLQLLMEWLTYDLNPRCNTYDPSILGSELSGFREHRGEQAILTLLIHKYGFRLYREACQAGAGVAKDKNLYPVLFQQDSDLARNTAQVLGSRFRNV